MHLRVLANLPGINDTMPPISGASRRIFEANIRTPQQLHEHINDINTLLSASQVSLTSSIQKSTCAKRVGQLHLVSETLSQAFKADCARLGLMIWHPDVEQSPDCLWNDAHRLVFLRTFKAAMIAREYDWIPALNPDRLKDPLLMLKLYNHTVHHLWANKTLKERAGPGSMAKKRARETAGKRRSRVRTALRHRLLLI